MKFIPQNKDNILSNRYKTANPITEMEMILLANITDKHLREAIKAGMKGVAFGLEEREIPPLTKRYINAYLETAKDIQETWQQLHTELTDLELFYAESYEYGIKMAYYTEWQLDSKDICF